MKAKEIDALKNKPTATWTAKEQKAYVRRHGFDGLSRLQRQEEEARNREENAIEEARKVANLLPSTELPITEENLEKAVALVKGKGLSRWAWNHRISQFFFGEIK